MRASFSEIVEKTNGWIDLRDITAKVERAVKQEKVSTGVALVYAMGEETALITLEAEMALILDAADMTSRLVKDTRTESRGKVAAALLGNHVAIPIVEGFLDLGTWQQIMLVDLGKPGDKKVLVQVIWE